MDAGEKKEVSLGDGTMRAAMKKCVSEMIRENDNTILLLIDIGAFGFREFMDKYPDQVKNIGIFEPGIIGIAAGISLTGIVPTVYGISPFIVQRALEQLKLDFVYQKTGGNFITTGASYDFSELGYSHYCSEDIQTLKTLPGMEILVPGTPRQFETLFQECCMNGKPSYFRMTDHCNQHDLDVVFGKAAVLKHGKKATVVTFAEMMDVTLEACRDLDVTVLYYTTAEPFDYAALRNSIVNHKVFVSQPFYEGTFYADVIRAAKGMRIEIDGMGVPLTILRSYGTKNEKDIHLGFTASNIKQKIQNFIENPDC